MWTGGIVPSIRKLELNAASGRLHAPVDLPAFTQWTEGKNNFPRADFIPIYYNSQYTSNNPIPTGQVCTLVFVYAIGENHKPNFFPQQTNMLPI